MSELCAALDVGTSKIATIIAKMSGDSAMEVIGVGHSPSHGMEKGVVTDVSKLSSAIKHSLREAENMADCSVQSVFVGISGNHVMSISSRGITSCGNVEIDQDTKRRAIECATEHELARDCELLHAVPRHFSLDGTSGIREPVGMSGTRLEAHVLLLACAADALQNLKNCLHRCGVRGATYILEHIASSEAVLSEHEKELGVCLVDIGGGTTDIAVFSRGALAGIGVIPVGGDHVTRDLTCGLNIPFNEAESLKLKHGTVVLDKEDPEGQIEISGLGGRDVRHISTQHLAEVICPRYEELFESVAQKLRKIGCDPGQLVAGIVLTGGSCQIDGAIELAEEIFKVQVRIGMPDSIRGAVESLQQPNFSTTVGLLRFGYKSEHARAADNWWIALYRIWLNLRNKLRSGI
jgi:cell division protein FtsA